MECQSIARQDENGMTKKEMIIKIASGEVIQQQH
jgi:hypothetical protein